MANKKVRAVPLLNLRRVSQPGPDVLLCGAVYENTMAVRARVYGPNRMKLKLDWFKLENDVFAVDFDFNELGNYIFVIEEDGNITTILNAKVYA